MERENSYDSKQHIIDVVNEIIDDRHEIERQLDDSTQAHCESVCRYQISEFSPNSDVQSYFQAPNTVQSAELTCEFAKENGQTAINKITLTPDDGPALTLQRLQLEGMDGYYEVNVGSGIADSEFAHSALLSVLPSNYRHLNPTDEQLTKFLQNEGMIDSRKTFQTEDGDSFSFVNLAQLETVDDTLANLEIIKLFKQSSGDYVGTKLRIVESIRRAMQTQTDLSVSIDVVSTSQRHGGGNTLHTIDELYSGDVRSINVSRITRTHLEHTLEALSELRRSAEVANS